MHTPDFQLTRTINIGIQWQVLKLFFLSIRLMLKVRVWGMHYAWINYIYVYILCIRSGTLANGE